MKIPVMVDFSEEVEVNITPSDIRMCLADASPDEGLNAALCLLNDVAKVFNGLPDTIIEEMSPKQHETIRDFLLKAAARFSKSAADNAVESQAIAQQAAAQNTGGQ